MAAFLTCGFNLHVKNLVNMCICINSYIKSLLNMCSYVIFNGISRFFMYNIDRKIANLHFPKGFNRRISLIHIFTRFLIGGFFV